MAKSWDELKPEFSHVAFRRGIENVADAIPADRSTVYRILNGETQNPTRAIRAAMERIVDEYEGERNE